MAGCGQLETVTFVERYGTPEQRNTIAARVGVENKGAKAGIGSASLHKLVVNCLAANRVIYCKKNPGDCGTPVPPPTGKIKAASFTAQGVGAAAGIASSLAPTAAITGVLGVASFGIGLIMAPLLGILSHHAKAVAREQETICAVSLAWEGYALSMEEFLPTGDINTQDARSGLAQLHGQMTQMLSGIEKQCNAACGYRKVIDALRVWNDEFVIPSLAQPLGAKILPAAITVGAVLVGAKLGKVF